MASTIAISTIPDDVKERLKKFRFEKRDGTQALLLKIDKATQQFLVDTELNDCDIEEVAEELPAQQPRFLLLSYKQVHDDGRISNPMCLVFYSPAGCPPDMQMLYAGSRNTLVNECELTKNFDIRDAEELTEQYVHAKCR
ncbi:unnamed protein product, partial [Mesorhabditis spiculigera]